MVKGEWAVASLLTQGPPGVGGPSVLLTPANLTAGGKGERKHQLKGKASGPQRPREAHPCVEYLPDLGPAPTDCTWQEDLGPTHLAWASSGKCLANWVGKQVHGGGGPGGEQPRLGATSRDPVPSQYQLVL